MRDGQIEYHQTGIVLTVLQAVAGAAAALPVIRKLRQVFLFLSRPTHNAPFVTARCYRASAMQCRALH